MTVKIIYDKHSGDAPYIAYNPELDVSSCGLTEKKARENLHEVVGIVLKEAGKKEAGFEKEKRTWKSPRIIFESFRFPATH